MAVITVNGFPLLGGTIVQALKGNWRADLNVGSDGADITGDVVIDDNGIFYQGTVERGGVDHTRWNGRVVGGKGKLPKPILPRAYQNSTAGVVLADLMTETGERLAIDSNPLVTNFALAQWFRFGNLEDALEQLVVDLIHGNWRVRRDGSIWVGFDVFPPLSVEVVIEERSDERRIWTVATERTELEPGVTFEGRKVLQVTHRVEEGLRSEVSLG
jgi:hypothetical protein